jgi:hypothetical protein
MAAGVCLACEGNTAIAVDRLFDFISVSHFAAPLMRTASIADSGWKQGGKAAGTRGLFFKHEK